jgi:hypothetical protein
MIQKMRDYLIGNEENRASILYIVAVCLIAGPVMIIFFGNKKEKNIICKINGVEINKKIINLKIQEQRELTKNIYDALGREMAEKFIEMIYQGKGIEDYVYMQEINNAIIKSIFIRNLNVAPEVSENIIKNVTKNNIKKMESIVGNIISKILTDTSKYSTMLNRMGLTADKIDENVEDTFNNLLTMNIIKSIILVIEKKIIGNQKKINKVEIDIYERNGWKESCKKEAKEKSKNTKEELLSEYQLGLKRGTYNTSEEYTINVEILVDENKGKDIEKRIKILEATKKDKKELIEKIKKEFKITKTIELKIKIENNKIKCENKEIAQDVLEEIIRKSRSKNFLIKKNERLFLCEIKEVKKPEIIKFDEAIYKIEENLLEKKAKELKKKEIEKVRYDLEKNKKINREEFKNKLITIKSEDITKENQTEEEKYLKNKIINASLRDGAIFVEEENDKDNVKIYYVKNIEYNHEEKNERIIQLIASQMMIECLKNSAKIEEYNKKEALSEIEI